MAESTVDYFQVYCVKKAIFINFNFFYILPRVGIREKLNIQVPGVNEKKKKPLEPKWNN